MQLMLADNRRARIAQQFVIVQQTSRDGVLNGQHADGRRVLLHIGKDLLERRATDELYLLAVEVEVCRNVVERPYQSLYGYSLHLPIFNNKSRFHWYVKRDLVSFSSLKPIRDLPLHNCLQSKSNSRKSMRCGSAFVFCFYCFGCKSITFSRFLQIIWQKSALSAYFLLFSDYKPSGLMAE